MTNDALTKADEMLPARLRGKKSGNRGLEHFKPTDIQIPRINIAQGLSPEVTTGDPKKIPGLEMGMLFNNLTREIYGAGPMEFFVVKASPPRAVEFIPRKEGGGVKDRNVPLDDPRLQWGSKGEKPIATLFYDYVIVLAESKAIVGLSMKVTSIKAAKALNGMMALRKADIFEGKYTLGVAMEKNTEGTFGVYQVLNAGTQENPLAGWATDEEVMELEKLFQTFKGEELELTEDEGGEASDEKDTDIPF